MSRITDYPPGTPGSSDELPYWDATNSVTKKALKSNLGFGTGDASTNTATSVDSEIALFSSTTGKIIKRASTTGILKGTSGVLSAATSGTDYAPGTSANTTGIVKSTTTTGALTTAVAADFPTLNQDTTGKSAKTDALNSATTIVDVANATAPSTGQVLTATDSTHATWQTPSGGGGGGGEWTYVTGSTLSGTGHFAISSLDGNTDVRYRLRIWAKLTAGVGGYDLGFNDDVVGTNNTSEAMFGFNATTQSTQNAGTTTIKIATAIGGANILSIDAVIYATSGQERIVDINYVGHRTGGSTYLVAARVLGVWLDTTTNMTKINMRNSGAVSVASGYYRLYKASNP